MWRNFQNVIQINLLTMTVALYLCLHETITIWTSIALLLFDAACFINQHLGFPSWLCRMTRWNRPPLKRQQAARRRQHSRPRRRSPRLYIRPTRRSKGKATVRWRYGTRKSPTLFLAICATSLQQPQMHDAFRHRLFHDRHRQLRIQVPVGRQAGLRWSSATPHHPSQGHWRKSTEPVDRYRKVASDRRRRTPP